MDKIYGYWVDYPEGIYFVRGSFEALPQHVAAFEGPMVGVTVTPVTQYKDIAKWVILRHLKRGVIFYVGWSPELSVPIEHDHTGKIAYEVLDFAESKDEAEDVVKQIKSQK